MIMTYIYLNYENMKNVIASLADYANKAENAQSDVVAANEQNNNPSSLSNVSKLSGKVQELRDKTKEIDDRVEMAKAQNESGITTKDSSGSIAYYIPDNMEDNINNAKSANQAIEDIKNLKEEKESLKARSQVKQHCDNDAYAAAFVEHYGTQNTMKLSGYGMYGGGEDVESNVKLSSSLIARASRTWDKEKSREMSDAVVNDAKSKEYPSLTIFESTSIPYGKDFLVGLANGVEGAGMTRLLPSVVKAMRATPAAALEYAIPDANVDSTKAYDYIIKKLNLIPALNNAKTFNSWTDDWAFIMAACADKYGYEKVDDKHPITDGAKRSALLAAAGVDWVGEEKTGFISPQARHNLASVLKCYAWSVDEAARRTDATGDVRPPASHIDTDPSDGRDPVSSGLTVQPQFNTDRLARVLGSVSRDQNDFSSVTRSVGEFNANRMAYASAQAAKGDTGALQTAMNSSSSTRGFLIGAGHAENEKDAANKDARNREIISTVMGLTSFVPGLPEAATFFEKAGYSYALNRGSDGLKGVLEKQYASNFNKAVEANSEIKANDGHRMQLELLYSLASGGAIKGAELDKLKSAVPKLFSGEEMNNDDLDALDDVITNPNGILTDEQQTAMTVAQGEYQKGYNITHKKR